MKLPDNDKCVLTKQLQARSYHIDFTGRLAIPSLFSFFQELAWEQAKENSFGYEHLKKENLFWVLSRVRVVIRKLPEWTSSFKMSTWASGIDGIFALRDFSLTDDRNNLVGATSGWLIVDAETRRPKRAEILQEKMMFCENCRATDGNAQKILKETDKLICKYEMKSGILDIDVNGHINNTKYIEWAVNSIPKNDYKNNPIKEVNVNFLAEGFYNDLCTIETFLSNDKGYLTTITRQTDNRCLAIISVCL